VSASDGSSKSNRSWLTNSSYQPAPPPPPKHEDRPPPSKRAKEDKKTKEKKEQKTGAAQGSTAASKPVTNWLEECGLPPQEAYRLDGGGDRANLQYSALYSGDIATYRRRFGGRCLGLGPDQSIEWTDNRGSKLAKKSKDRASRYFTSTLPQNDACLYLGTHRTADKAPPAARQSHAPFFMALEPSSSTRSTEIKEGEENDHNHQLTSELYASQNMASYNRALQDDPHNVALWLEFLEFQPALQAKPGGEGGMDTSKATRALNERKLAIFERALEQNPTSQDLLVAHLELLRDMEQEHQSMMKRWRDLLFRMPNKPLLWIKYTEFARTQFSTFSLSSLSALYHKAFSTLTSIVEGVMKSHRAEPGTAGYLLVLFSQFTHCLAAAGQNERAVACYQALVEFNLACASDISSVETSRERAAFFEPFWDSGAPRLGETGAVGWGQWMEASQSQTHAKPLVFIDATFLATSHLPQSSDTNEGSDPELELIAGCSLPEAWLRLENQRQANDALPFRGSEDDLSDPERAVLFEDVSQSLFWLAEPHLRLKLVLQYLLFLGVELGQGGSPCLDSLPHLLSSHFHCPSCSSGCCPSLITSSGDKAHSSLHPHNFCGVGAGYRPLSTNDLLTTGAGHSLPSPAMSQFITSTFNQILSLLTELESQSLVAVEWVRFELSLLAPALRDPARSKTKDTRGKTKAVQKLVKSLLRHEYHRNNLALWDCCSQLESLISGPREAGALYESVLSQYPTITPPLLPLYQHYCEILMGLAGNIATGHTPSPESLSRALQCTVCVAEGRYSKSGPSGSAVLRTRHLFNQQSPSSNTPTPYLLCHAYFEYLSRGLQPASSVFDDIISSRETQLSSSSSPSPDYSDQELRTQNLDLHTLYRHQVALLLHHSESRPMPPTLLWGVLERALAVFPDDPFFLSAYTDSQQPLYLMGKLRKYFDSHAPRAQTVLPWLHAVRAEVARYGRLREGEMEGETDVPAGLVNRIRALLNRAIQSVNGRGCPLLWRLAMSFEVEQHRMSEAKALFYQAIQYCPGAKVVYWDTVRHFPTELGRVLEVMEERELRIRAPLEEVQMLLDATTQQNS
jgi:tetratricopeptide (TPR) repeat protein